MNQPIDTFLGTKIELLTVIHRDPARSTPTAPFYMCRCVCGKVKSFHKSLLIAKTVVSCGCSAIASLPKVEPGAKFNLWTVVEKDTERTTKVTVYWKCKCDCGKEKSVASNNLRSGMSRSCGCLRGSEKRTVTRQLGRPKKSVEVSVAEAPKVEVSFTPVEILEKEPAKGEAPAAGWPFPSSFRSVKKE